MQTRLLPSLGIVLNLFLAACGGGPPAAPSGGQYLADARNSLAASDFNAALKNLERTIKAGSDQPTGQQAGVLRAVLLTALAEGDKQMADAYGIGIKEPASRASFGTFGKTRTDYYNAARARLMEAMQAVMDQRRKLGDAPIPIEVNFPGFTGAEDPALAKIKGGHLAGDSERSGAEVKARRNALARILTAIAGAGQDPNKGQAVFSKGKVDIAPAVYQVEMSGAFLRIGAIFDRRANNEPDRLRTVNEVVRDTLDLVLKSLAAKPDKELQTRAKKMREECEKTLKTLGSS